MAREVVSSRSVKVNLGDYQSIDFFVSVKDDVSDGNGPTVMLAYEKCRRLAEAAMLRDLVLHFKRRGSKISVGEICKRYGLPMPKSEQPK